jgi:hypothetical protein
MWFWGEQIKERENVKEPQGIGTNSVARERMNKPDG